MQLESASAFLANLRKNAAFLGTLDAQILFLLEENGSVMDMRTVCKIVEDVKPGVSRAVSRLVRRGLASKRRTETDDRCVIIVLTGDGASLVKTLTA